MNEIFDVIKAPQLGERSVNNYFVTFFHILLVSEPGLLKSAYAPTKRLS